MEKDKDKEKSNVSPTNYEHTARLRTVDIEKPKKKMFNKERLRSSIKTSPLYRKKYTILALIVLVAFIGAYQLVKVREINFTTLPENISRKIDGEDLERGNALTLRKLYSINDMEYDDFVLFAPKSNMVADEILVVKCKPGQADSVMAKIQNRIENQSNSFKNYAPAQYGIISSSELSKKGDYVYFISAKNMGAINKAIKDSYK
ncbi:DUF4358 domain-containing protein [Peptostreptococcus russellii]|uniref:DUF4358 domain-containing protein n=1 Tax=Peptostreptococcus russellii TaxID=215200 RepID=UPI00162425D9|nr:DUF4358 domain-containing protein [Peptostreptococcus russellii]MBC2577042.1 DUF4358 domain-containing protein [Peptostreptococcus russellii]